jgi:transcriptional regulator with XRE-family HTH domain
MAIGTVYERIKIIRKTLKISQREFVKRIYISQSLLAEMETGRRNVNKRIIQLIASQYNVNKDWLLTGKGEMFTESMTNIKFEELTEIFNALDDMLKDYLLLQSKELLKIQKKKMNS